MPVKFTWKSIVGLLAAIGAPVTAATAQPSTITGWVLLATSIGGWLVVAAERLADSKDFATLGGADVAAEIARVKAAGEHDLALAKAEIARLAPAAEAWTKALAAAAPSTAAVPASPPAQGVA